MNTSEYLRNHLRKLGFEVPKNANQRGKILLFFAVFFALETLNAVITNWENLQLRFLAMEDLNVTVAMCGLYFDYGTAPRHVDALLSMSEEGFFTYSTFELSEEKKRTISECEDLEKRWARKVANAVKIFVLNIVLVKIFMRLILLIPYNGVKSVEDLPFFFEFIYPFNNPSILVFCIIFTLQFVYVLSIYPLANCVYTSGVLVMNRLCTEVKLLRISLKELDCLFPCEKVYLNESVLKVYTRELIQHHQMIVRLGIEWLSSILVVEVVRTPILFYSEHLKKILHLFKHFRKTKQLNDGIAVTASIINEVICLISCLSLYYFIEVRDLILKIKALSTLFVVLFLLLLYCSYGENTLSEGEKLREALYFTRWVDRPQWFKTTQMVMMSYAKKPIAVKPFGLYVVNLNNYATIVNAAYSIFNFLKTTHQK